MRQNNCNDRIFDMHAESNGMKIIVRIFFLLTLNTTNCEMLIISYLQIVLNNLNTGFSL